MDTLLISSSEASSCTLSSSASSTASSEYGSERNSMASTGSLARASAAAAVHSPPPPASRPPPKQLTGVSQLASSYLQQQQRSNSISYKHPSSSHLLNYSQSINAASSATTGGRRPSFKFESNTILNRVQSMGMGGSASARVTSGKQRLGVEKTAAVSATNAGLNGINEEAAGAAASLSGYGMVLMPLQTTASIGGGAAAVAVKEANLKTRILQQQQQLSGNKVGSTVVLWCLVSDSDKNFSYHYANQNLWSCLVYFS